MEMTLRWYGSKNDSVTLQQIRQIPGVHGVITTLYDTTPGEVWSRERIRAMKDEVEAAGLRVAGLEERSCKVHRTESRLAGLYTPLQVLIKLLYRLVGGILCVRKGERLINDETRQNTKLDKSSLIVFTLLFALCILSVLGILAWYISLAIRFNFSERHDVINDIFIVYH